MRPVRRGDSPLQQDFKNYQDAFPDLVARLGLYCSYCERAIPTGMAVEHLQPKGLPKYVHLKGRWTNFLIACVNCNSTKLKKDVDFALLLFPDRDNTFHAFEYRPDGVVIPAPHLDTGLSQVAEATLALTGLDKPFSRVRDANGQLLALDRVSQRMEVWGKAQVSRAFLEEQPDNRALSSTAIELARSSGYFSVWMTVFEGFPEFQKLLIDAFPGTRESGCFDLQTSKSVTPCPNLDGLAHGGKI